MRTLPILVILIFSSCATVLKNKTYDLRIQSSVSNSKVTVGDRTYELPSKVNVVRSKKDLKISLTTSESTTEYTIKASPNPTFLYLNLAMSTGSPIGYLIDFTNQKRFYYGRTLYLNPNDTGRIIQTGIKKQLKSYLAKDFPTHKGQVNFTVSLPYVNNFLMKPEHQGQKFNTGFLGLSTGLEYYYADNRFLSLSANAATDFFLPIVAPVDQGPNSDVQRMNSINFNLTNNVKVKRNTFGYGLNYSRNSWSHNYVGKSLPEGETSSFDSKTSQSVGLTLSGYHQFTRNFFVGIVYRPTFLKVAPTVKADYEHLISLDFAWKITLRNQPSRKVQ